MEKGIKMVKPRHHTLQGICQDVCVSYRSVVEVHRRIREVILKENGKVITQNLGTFFCRDVKARSGVLNGTEWTSEPYIEVGLKGERSDGVHVDIEPALSFESVVLRNGVGFTNFEGLPVFERDPFYTELVFGDDGEATFFARDAGDAIVAESVASEVTRIPFDGDVEGLVEGYNNVELSLTNRFDNTGPPVGLGVIAVGGEIIGIGDSIVLDPLELISLASTPAFDSLFFQLREIGYQITFVFGTMD